MTKFVNTMQEFCALEEKKREFYEVLVNQIIM